ncbi:MAG: hypothetical protein SPJ13_01570 [Bacteroidales bacterium]|nr:hypothetical protein [Bacteroidales bacterium]
MWGESIKSDFFSAISKKVRTFANAKAEDGNAQKVYNHVAMSKMCAKGRPKQVDRFVMIATTRKNAKPISCYNIPSTLQKNVGGQERSMAHADKNEN